MHNKKVKFLSILCATALVGQGMPVSAEEVTVKDEGSQSVDVTASISPDYTVTIPKSLLLDEDGSAEYTVTASGEIEKLSTLTVTPEESFVLTTRYDSATATVSQEKTSWSDTDLLTDSEKTTTGTIAVEGGLAPGEWSGTFNFEIALNEHVHEYSTTNGTTHTCSICNTSGEHDYDDGTVTTEATCTTEGVKTFKCTSCDESYTEAIPMVDHKDENSDTVCDVCSELVAGLYDENNVMTASWDELLEDGTIHVTDGVLTTNYVSSYSDSNTSSDSLVGKLIVDNSVISMGDVALGLCSGLTEVVLPSSVTSIGCKSFFGCSSLKSVNIPSSVTSIDNFIVFGRCSSLESITVDSGNTVYDSRNDCNAIIETATNTLIAGCKNTIIPDTVTSIGRSAFWNCSSLTSITIPTSVTSIGNNAFLGCSSLTSVVIPSSVTSIGDSAFYNCSGLTSITIPSSVTSIGNNAFQSCSSLPSITIPDSVTSIGICTFADCSSLTSVTFSDGVTSTSIGNYAFSGCSSLTSIVIPSSVTSIGDHAFFGCTSLTGITILSSVTSIGEDAFSGCSSLTSVTLSDGVTSIGQCAFKDCTSLTSITIPSSVTSIGSLAFYNCGTFTINYKGTQTQWNAVTKDTDWSKNSTPTIVYNYTE